jgi:hypothetical protein
MNPTQTVQLRHTTPDGRWHIDWMLARDAEGPLATLRLEQRLDSLPAGSTIPGRMIGDHRRQYLTYEGPLTADRGTVACVARGWILAWEHVGDDWWITLSWQGQGQQRLVVSPLGSGLGGKQGGERDCSIQVTSSDDS